MDFEQTIVRSNRRSICLEIRDNASLLVRAPFSLSPEIIGSFIRQKQGWIERKLEHARRKKVVSKKFENNEEFYYLGKPCILNIISQGRVPLELLEQDGIKVFHFSKEYLSHARKIFTGWYKEQAKNIIRQRVVFFSLSNRLDYSRITLRDAATCWGSCGRNNSLNFNWRLIMAPLEVLDYVVVHELAHTRHKNHSRVFWESVENILPDYKIRRKWLKDNRYELMSIGSAN
jgi:predicted metal-dependent hydrolase